MKRAVIALLLSTLLALAAPARAQKPQPTEPDFRETLSKATLAVYAGKQVCKYVQVQSFFGPVPVWQCGFESHFVCTSTVVRHDDRGDYMGLTAGHCFDYKAMDKGWEYYISEGVNEKPVLRKIDILKFENNDRYDYALFNFRSMREYPVILVEGQSSVPALGKKIINVNFSYAITREVTEGVVVSGIVGDLESTDAPALRGRYFIQMPFGPGSSGSAVVDEETHKIVGMVEISFRGTQMAAMIMPAGPRFKDFMEDQSIGMKPKPEPAAGPQGQPGESDEDDTVLHRIFLSLKNLFHKK